MSKSTKRRNTFLEYIESKNELGAVEHDDLLIIFYNEDILKDFLVKNIFPDGTYTYNAKHHNKKILVLKDNETGLIRHYLAETVVPYDDALRFPDGCRYSWYRDRGIFDGSVDHANCTHTVRREKVEESIHSFLKFVKSNGCIPHELISEHTIGLDYSKKYDVIKIMDEFMCESKTDLVLSDIMSEKMLQNQYKEFGFLDVSFNLEETTHIFYTAENGQRVDIEHNRANHFGFIELKTGKISFGQLTREMEFYKSVIPKSGIAGYKTILAIAIADVEVPSNFTQYKLIPLGKTVQQSKPTVMLN